MRQFVVYVIRCSKTTKIYVGKTCRPSHRWSVHRWLAHHYPTRSQEPVIYRAIRKYGVEHFSFDILERCADEAQASERERFWIKKLKSMIPNGYNMSAGGEGQTGFRPSLEARRKMSLSGASNGCFGRIWTESERERHAELTRSQFAKTGHPFLGRRHSEESRAKMSASARGNTRCVGRAYTNETIEKMRLAHRGRVPWNKGKKTGPMSAEARAKKSVAHMAYWSSPRGLARRAAMSEQMQRES